MATIAEKYAELKSRGFTTHPSPPLIELPVLRPDRSATGGTYFSFIGTPGQIIIYWHPTIGAHEVYGAILMSYLAHGGPVGALGFPVSGEYDDMVGETVVGRVSDFEHGSISWNRVSGGMLIRPVTNPNGSHTFTIDMSSPFRSGWQGGLGGPNSGGHVSPEWYIQFGMDLGVVEGTEVFAAFAGHVTTFQPHRPSRDTSKVYGAQLFMRSGNDMMGGFYTHITGSTFTPGEQINRGDRLGITLRDHLHLALVEIIGGVPGGRYKGVDLYRHFVALKDQPRVISVTFKQDGSPPAVTP